MNVTPRIELERRSPPAIVRYTVALLAVALTLGLRLSLRPYMSAQTPYISFFLGIVLSSWFGGLGPGTVTTLVSVASAWYYKLIPVDNAPGNWVALLLFIGEGILIAYLIEVMRVSKRRVTGIVESISDGFAVFDRDWRMVYVNENGAEMAGFKPGELIGRSVWDVFPGAIDNEFWDKMREAMREQRPIHFDSFSQDRKRWFEHSAYPSREGLSLYTRDITDRKNAREEIEAAKAEVERMAEQLEQRVQERTAQLNSTIKELEAFSYSVSHDLRAPLRAIDGFSRMLDEDYRSKLDAEGRRIIEVIRHSTINMGNLIDGLLAFSRLGRQAMGSSEIDMTELARDAFNELGVGNDRQIHVSIADLPPAIGDRVLLRQVLVNLFSNAVKFSRGRNPAIIEMGAKVEKDQNVFFLKDNGVGFDMKYVDKMFGVFQRLHAVNEFEGTGLGLAIVQRIVHRHGGRVWAEGSSGQGAVIYFSLPKIEAGAAYRSA